MPGRDEVPTVKRFEVTGNPENGKPEMVSSPNPLGGGWVRYSDYESLADSYAGMKRARTGALHERDNAREKRDQVRNQERQRIQEALEGLQRFVPGMADEGDPDGSEYPTIRPHYDGDLLRRGDVLASLDTLDPSKQEVRSDDADQGPARGSTDAPSVDGPPRPSQSGTEGGAGVGADPSPARSRTRSAELDPPDTLDPSGEQGEEAKPNG